MNCPVQDKVKFTRKQSARAAADNHMDRDRVGVYRCYHCRFWHVGHTDGVRWTGMRLRMLKRRAA